MINVTTLILKLSISHFLDGDVLWSLRGSFGKFQLNKANTSDTEAAFLDLRLSISNDVVSTKIYDKRDDFDFEIVNFPFFRW